MLRRKLMIMLATLITLKEWFGYPLLVTEAKAGNLDNWKLYGNSKQSITIDGKEYILPEGYTLLSYLEHTGTQYINTGLLPKSTQKWEITIKDIGLIGGNYMGRSVTSARASICTFTSAVKVGAIILGLSNLQASTWNNLKHTYTLDMPNMKFNADGTDYNLSGTIGTLPAENILLFADSGGYGTKQHQIFSSKIWENGVLVRNYIPMKRNSDNELGMYDLCGSINTTTNTPFYTNAGTGSFTAGSEAPTPEQPIDIKGVGDRTPNLCGFNAPECIKLNANFSSGVVTTNNDHWCVFMPIEGGKTYSLWENGVGKTSGWYICQVAADTVAIGTSYQIDDTSTFVNLKGSDHYTLTTNSKAKWLGISVSASVVQGEAFFKNNCVVVEGSSVPSDYIPYGCLLPITVHQKTGAGYQEGINLFDKNAVTVGYYLDRSGTLVANSKWYVSDYMPVEGGKTYYQTLATPGQAPSTCWYDSNKTFISAVTQQAGGTQVAPSNAKYCRMSIWEADLNSVMFTEGATAPTEYIPYSTVTVYTNSPMEKIGTFADVMDYENQSIVRNIGVKVLDGTEGWTWQEQYNRLRLTIEEIDSSNILNLFCSHYKPASTSSTSVTQGVNISSTALYLKDTDNISDLASGKAYLAQQYANGTPVTVYYPLATPTTEQLTVPALTVTTSDSKITCDTTVKPNDMYGCQK